MRTFFKEKEIITVTTFLAGYCHCQDDGHSDPAPTTFVGGVVITSASSKYSWVYITGRLNAPKGPQALIPTAYTTNATPLPQVLIYKH